MTARRITPESDAAHLTPAHLERAQRALVCKAIAEFSHERMLEPRASAGDDEFRLDAPVGGARYRFRARVHPLEHWVLDPESLVRMVGERPAALDIQQFLVEFAGLLGIPDRLLPTYLEELASTLAAYAWKLRHKCLTSAELVNADYQTIEAAMTEGHPAFVANNGRIGFGVDDYGDYAPEAGEAVHLVWLAVRRSRAELSVSYDLDERRLYAGELGEETLHRFCTRLTDLGLDPASYLFLPLHPWQWTNKVAIAFAPDLARQDLVVLEEGLDDHRPQQSIRTFFNTSHPERHYVKTALSIQNMGFMRGLSPKYMRDTPAINDWVSGVVTADATLRDCGFTVLRERAAIGYTGDAFHALGFTSAYQKMLAALWRESPVQRIGPGERLATMASLLHRDTAGRSLVTALIEASPVDAAEWVRAYLRAYLRPLVHCLLRYDLAFMPHGENLVMVLHDHVPTRMIMKDVGEEVAVLGELPLPEEVERIRADVPDDLKALAVHTDVFDGFFRYLAAILDEDGVLPVETFWTEVNACLELHEADHPGLADAAAAYDLRRPEFRHSCLNRLQLRNTLEMVDLGDQADSLMFAGSLVNPAAARSRVQPAT